MRRAQRLSTIPADQARCNLTRNIGEQHLLAEPRHKACNAFGKARQGHFAVLQLCGNIRIAHVGPAISWGKSAT